MIDADIVFSASMVARADSDPWGGLLFGLIALIASVAIVAAFIWLKEKKR